MSIPLVSIIIPVFNAEDYLDATINSALNQTWSNKEIIIVDDGSTDNSFAIAKKYETYNVKVIHQTNSGASAARNKGLSIAKGELIQYLDGDDLLPPDKIEVQAYLLMKNPNSLISCNWIRFKNDINNKFGALGPGDKIRQTIDPFTWLQSNQTMLVHAWLTPRYLLEKAGPWDEKISFNDDGDFFSRVVSYAEQVIFCEKTIVYYRTENPNSISRSITKQRYKSAYLAAISFENTLKRLAPKDYNINKTIGNRFKEITYDSYLYNMEIYNLCKNHKTIKYADQKFDAGGTFGKIIQLIFGWKTVKLLKYWKQKYQKSI